MDLGECPKIHDLALRADYELASKTKDYFYDIDVSMHIPSNPPFLFIYTFVKYNFKEVIIFSARIL